MSKAFDTSIIQLIDLRFSFNSVKEAVDMSKNGVKMDSR